MTRVTLVFALLCFALASAPAALARADVGYVDSDGVRIAYEVRGAGEPLVLIPGFSQSRRAWDDAGFVDAFVARGRQLILVDPRGHGDSDKPHDPESYGPGAVADDIVAVLDHLQIERADLLGYSRGGWIAIVTATRHPDRVRSVIAGGAHPYSEDMGPFRAGIAGGLRQWLELIESRVGSPLPDNARAMLLDNDADALRAAVVRDRPDLSAALIRSEVPVLLYAGSEDPRAGLARRFAQAAPRAEFFELPGRNHFQAFFAADQVAEAADRMLKLLDLTVTYVKDTPPRLGH